MDNNGGVEEPEMNMENIYMTIEDLGGVDSSSIHSESLTENPMNGRGSDKGAEVETAEPLPLFFIVPYRDREAHLAFFKPHMARLLADVDFQYHILYLHQKDKRSFNRGAMKNIGFHVVKQLLPDTYKNATLVFHDIDSLLAYLPTNLDFYTTPGKIKHFYGFTHTLGGILSINAGDFERINGFPNFWTWGYEDNLIQLRAQKAGIEIDRSVFFDIFASGPDKIVRLFQNSTREVNRQEYNRYMSATTEGADSITNIQYTINEETGFVDVTAFNTGVEEDTSQTKTHNLEYGNRPFNVKTKDVIKANFRAINSQPIPAPIIMPIGKSIQALQPSPHVAAKTVINNNHAFGIGGLQKQRSRAPATMGMRLG